MAQALIVIDIQEGLVKENPFDTKNFYHKYKSNHSTFQRSKYRSNFLSDTLKMKVY